MVKKNQYALTRALQLKMYQFCGKSNPKNVSQELFIRKYLWRKWLYKESSMEKVIKTKDGHNKSSDVPEAVHQSNNRENGITWSRGVKRKNPGAT